jgi:HSP20 family protein
MLTRWNTGWSDFEEAFGAMNQLRSYLDRALADQTAPARGGVWPRAQLADNGSAFVLVAEVPGLTDKDIELTLNQDVLTVTAERNTQAPEGFAVHRQERPALRFTRSFALPSRVDPEKTQATVKHGLLTVTLEKAKEAQPRQITVKAS